MSTPDTRPSLLVRLRAGDDHEAWCEFAEIYRPVILRLALAKGLQPADAEDLSQDVLLRVSAAMEKWEPDGTAKFRTWLHTVTRNAALNAITRAKPDRARGGDSNVDLLAQQPGAVAGQAAGDSCEQDVFSIETRREIFQWAARRVRGEFSEPTWLAFWSTAVESVSIEDAAQKLGRTRGAVYAARSRVMRRLAATVAQFDLVFDDESQP